MPLLGGRLARGVAWSLAGSLGLQATTLGAAILTARILGQEDFGALNLVRSTVLMLGALAGSGLGLAATTHVAELRVRDPLGAGRMVGLLANAALALGALGSLACWVLARPLAARLSSDADLEAALRAGALLLLAGALGGVLTGALTGLEAFRSVGWLLVFEGLLGLVLVPSGAWVAGVTGAVGGSVAAAVATLPLKYLTLGRQLDRAGIPLVKRHAPREWRGLVRLALPATALAFTVQPFEWGARVALTRGPNGFAELGVFAAAFSWGAAVLFLPAQVTGPAVPILTTAAAAGDRPGLLRLVRSMTSITVGLTLAVALPLAILARPIMASYGPGFEAGSRVLVVVLLAYSLAPFSGLFRTILASTGRMWWQLANAVIWGVALLAAFAVLESRGAMGLALAYLVAFGVVLLTQGACTWAALSRVSREGEPR